MVRMPDKVGMLVPIPEPWTPAQATERIRRIAHEDCFDLTLSKHAKEQMRERELTSLDVMYVLENGFIYDRPEKASLPGFYKYKMLNATPNSNRREVRVVVIPSLQAAQAKIVTVMWADEPLTATGV
jgi:hypothetical protein